MNSLRKEAEKRLQAQGGRMTAQRRLIFECLDRMTGHPTAEELYSRVRSEDPKINLSTIYRTLRWLEQEGLISALIFDEDRRQERFDPGRPTNHHHFVCTRCKAVTEFDDRLVDQAILNFEADYDVTVDSGTLILYGLCPECHNLAEGQPLEEVSVEMS